MRTKHSNETEGLRDKDRSSNDRSKGTVPLGTVNNNKYKLVSSSELNEHQANTHEGYEHLYRRMNTRSKTGDQSYEVKDTRRVRTLSKDETDRSIDT